MAPNRQIIYDKTFWEQAKTIVPDAQRLDDIIDGAVWAISTHPEKFPIVEKNLRVAFTDDFPNAPALRIYFSLTEPYSCTLHWIERLDHGEEFLGM